jgi:hypothetical protein
VTNFFWLAAVGGHIFYTSNLILYMLIGHGNDESKYISRAKPHYGFV